MKLAFNQNHPNDQKMMSKFELVQTKQFFRVLNKQYSSKYFTELLPHKSKCILRIHIKHC